MSVRGLRQIEARMRAALQEVVGISEQSIADSAFDLLSRAVELAPIDTSDLRGSGKVDFDRTVANRFTALVSFNTPYARIQHETLWFKHPNGGQAKYLQQPYEENIDKYIQHMKDSVRRELR